MKTALWALAVFVVGIAAGIGSMHAFTPEEKKIPGPIINRTTLDLPATAAPRRIGLVAHDARKADLLAWVEKYAPVLSQHELFSTGTTGRLVAEKLADALPGAEIKLTRFNSGPLGGDQQMGALISQGGLDVLVFFVDPLASHPHDADVKALLRLCRTYNIVLATTKSTADFVITSPYFFDGYAAEKPDYSTYVNRQVK